MVAQPTERLTWLGHATCVLDLGGARIVTDPLLGEHAGILRRRGGLAPTTADWTGADAVLVSHLHHDHAHAASLRSTGAPALMAPANTRWAHKREVHSIGLRPNQWWSPPKHPGVRIRVVPAVHGHRPMPHRPNAANGFVVVRAGDHSTPALRIWFAGDTELYPDMSRIPALAGGPIDLALVPIGGWGPRLSGGHMDPAQAAHACHLVEHAGPCPFTGEPCTPRWDATCPAAGWTAAGMRSLSPYGARLPVPRRWSSPRASV